MKRLLRLLLILIVVVWSGGTTLAQDLNAIMWQEGILFGRFSVCFADNSNVDRKLGRTFTDAYIHWYQVNNPRIDMKVPVSMFANGLHAGAAEQQKLGAEGCDAVHQRINHIGQVIGVRIPDVSRQPQAQSNNPSASAVPAAPPILLWHSNTGWVQGMYSYQLTFDGKAFSLKAQPVLNSSLYQWMSLMPRATGSSPIPCTRNLLRTVTRHAPRSVIGRETAKPDASLSGRRKLLLTVR